MRSPKKILVPLLLAGLLSRAVPAQNTASSGSPVLVELFTSQGCSSCPPAEELLNEWGLDAFQKGEIIPLAFHVDYWDYLGWKDPFSSALFTARQRDYVRALASDSIYTPQMVVGGKVGFVGSDAERAKKETTDGLERKTVLRLSLQTRKTNDGFRLKMEAQPAMSGSSDLRFFAAVFENGLSTQVLHGENAGRHLEENFVVREMKEITANVSKRTGSDVLIPWDQNWNPSKCGLVVFAQDKRTLEIKGVKCLYPLVP